MELKVPPGDDAAVLLSGLTVTMDTLVEGIHWDNRLSPRDVGYKLLAVSVSDLAAMGARPSWATLSLSMPSYDPAWVQQFSRGLAEALNLWNITLVGGDTTRSRGAIMLSLTLAGPLVGAPMKRSGAQPGDEIWVTGKLGLAGQGWMSQAPSDAALHALRHPTPPLPFALDLASQSLATAAMDLSDGLARDLPRLCKSSGLRAVIDPSLLPGEEGVTTAQQLQGGEDFQLLFTAPPQHHAALIALAQTHGLQLTHIGHCAEGTGAELTTGGWPAPGFAHFLPKGES